MKVELKGVIPAITTPFADDGTLDLDGFRELVEAVIGDGVHGIVVAGCTGESWALADDERATLFAAAVDQAQGRVPIVAGCGAITSASAIGYARAAENAGCAAAMIQPPWYVIPGESEVESYYRRIIAGCDIPIMLYNIPRRTGINMSADLIDRLADEPSVVALKESSKDWLVLSAMIRRVSDRISVLAGYASALGLAAISEGAVGYVDSMTPVVGRLSREFFDAAVSGDVVTARNLQGVMATLKFFDCGTFPATVKVALEHIGRPGGLPRDPIAPLTEDQRARIGAMLANAGLIPAATRRASA
ncbi:MAG: dihydrodipicolinate synthase family protein [Rhodospirillales bacterium]|jgi:4-hydroxy-tetrahydrodipicolinate synthase|nr:dihydrodipicolinate synthase family protein [Rhodospirillales bacterium]MDP6805905.1 dihydrodipicolinate synthase family protein [Rhodospirillales bacterium]